MYLRTIPMTFERQQSAFIRTLLDEANHYAASDHRHAALREQIAEERIRLTQWLAKSAEKPR